jgi:hypothetical protein
MATGPKGTAQPGLHRWPNLAHSSLGATYGNAWPGSHAAREALGWPTGSVPSGVAHALAHSSAHTATTLARLVVGERQPDGEKVFTESSLGIRRVGLATGDGRRSTRTA